MTRLTDAMRGNIIRKLMEHRFATAERALVKSASDLAMRIYRDAFDAKARSMMSKLPKGWLPETTSIAVKFGGSYDRLTLAEAVRIPQSRDRSTFKAYEADHELAQAYEDYAKAKSTLDNERSELRAKADAVLQSASTVKRLLELWPEAEPFVDPKAVKPQQLPTVTVASLNIAFKLPVETKRKPVASAAQ